MIEATGANAYLRVWGVHGWGQFPYLHREHCPKQMNAFRPNATINFIFNKESMKRCNPFCIQWVLVESCDQTVEKFSCSIIGWTFLSFSNTGIHQGNGMICYCREVFHFISDIDNEMIECSWLCCSQSFRWTFRGIFHTNDQHDSVTVWPFRIMSTWSYILLFCVIIIMTSANECGFAYYIFSDFDILERQNESYWCSPFQNLPYGMRFWWPTSIALSPISFADDASMKWFQLFWLWYDTMPSLLCS
jgi:hypothetical protein